MIMIGERERESHGSKTPWFVVEQLPQTEKPRNVENMVVMAFTVNDVVAEVRDPYLFLRRRDVGGISFIIFIPGM